MAITDKKMCLNAQDIPKEVDSLIERGIEIKASDLHLEPRKDGLKVRFRVDGIFCHEALLSPEVSEEIRNRVKVMARLAVHRSDIPQDGAIEFKGADTGAACDLRVSTMPVVSGEKIVIRFFDLKGQLYGINELGFDGSVVKGLENILTVRDGLFLICGPSGSGKTTTIYSLLRELIKRKGDRFNIVSIEDPVERVIDGVNQTQLNTNSGLDYAACMRAIMRQDPEVIVVGEIRDPETAEAVLRASYTGHLVISTLHCGRAHEAVSRMVELGVSPGLLSGSLRGVAAQRLVRMLCSDCKGKGCEACMDSGFRGRTAFGEYIDFTKRTIREAVAAGCKPGKIAQAVKNAGISGLEQAGKRLVRKKITNATELQILLEG